METKRYGMKREREHESRAVVVLDHPTVAPWQMGLPFLGIDWLAEDSTPCTSAVGIALPKAHQ
jgi:hypothetical protein